MNFTHRKKWFIAPLILLAIAGFSLLMMLLWNALMPQIFHLPALSYWQAMGLLVLSRLLFGGGPGGRGHHHPWKNQLVEKFRKMDPEQRERFFEHLQRGYHHDWSHWQQKQEASENKNQPNS